MIEEAPPLLSPTTSDPVERSLVEDVKRLVEDGRTLLAAELAYHKSRAAVAGTGAKSIAIWGALALALAFFALMALVMGLLLALQPVLGGWGALVAVVVGLLFATGICGLVAKSKWSRMARVLSEKDTPQ